MRNISVALTDVMIVFSVLLKTLNINFVKVFLQVTAFVVIFVRQLLRNWAECVK